MQYYTDKTYTQEKHGHTFTIKWEVEEWADLDDLGEFTQKADDYIVDRQDGTLRGAMPPEPEEPEVDKPYPEDYPDTDEGQAEYDAAHTLYDDAWDKHDEAMDEWEENGQAILEQWLPRMGRGEYRYFKPYAGGLDPEENLEEWTKYAVQDYRRISDYGNGWCYLYLVVTTPAPTCKCCGHTETLSASVGFIESDISDADADGFINELIYELEKQLEKYEEDK